MAALGVYVIDHPQRDMPGLAWWAMESQMHSADRILLIPMGEMSEKKIREVSPDFIVWNYARPANLDRLIYSHSLGIRNIIHDTEGIPYDMESGFKNSNPDCLRVVSEIWCWGERQASQLSQICIAAGSSAELKVTGSIRYEYVKSLPKAHEYSKMKGILWNTNFPLCSPRYQHAAQEVKDYVYRDKTHSMEEVLEEIIDAANSRALASADIYRISRHVNLPLVIRPHPFESSGYYLRGICEQIPDARLSHDTDIHHELPNVICCMQSGCQTVLDAYLRGVPSFTLSSSSNCNLWAQLCLEMASDSDLSLLASPLYLQEAYEAQTQRMHIQGIGRLLYNLDLPLNLTSTQHEPKPKAQNILAQSQEEQIAGSVLHRIKCKLKSAVAKSLPRVASRNANPKYSIQNGIAKIQETKAISSAIIADYLSSVYGNADWMQDGICSISPEHRRQKSN